MTLPLFTFKEDIGVPIPGLVYISDYLSPQCEEDLIKIIDDQNWRNDLKRRVQHYGYRYDYKARTVSAKSYMGPLPGWLADVADRLYQEKQTLNIPDQVIINEYQPGQGISPHIDCVACFHDEIISLSLGSDCVMQFTHPTSLEKKDVFLARRSLVILKGPARYEW